MAPTTVARLAAAHVAFRAVLYAAQCTQLLLGVTASHTPGLNALPTLCGLAAVACASAAAISASASLPPALPSPPSADAALVGVALYAACARARFSSLAPSDLRSAGAFAARRASLAASPRYATRAERKLIHQLGRRHGCHSCGARAPPFHADHVPPLWDARRPPRAAWRRVLRRPAPLRFHPQCLACSGKQAALLSALSAGREVPVWARSVLHTPPLRSAASVAGNALVACALASENGCRAAAAPFEVAARLSLHATASMRRYKWRHQHAKRAGGVPSIRFVCKDIFTGISLKFAGVMSPSKTAQRKHEPHWPN
ncbi:hypothetical protein AB1Y20_004889 [Prymnesium parvum]|uniref:Uncharacterized protein n=1 Tax=Prymnesium parvum TaxID=97485 RepID=A0AB34IZH0_PRYPA